MNTSQNPTIGFHGRMELTKIHGPTGRVIGRYEAKPNAFLSDGFQNIAQQLAGATGSQTRWGASNMRLRIYEGNTLDETLDSARSDGVTSLAGVDETRGEFWLQVTDPHTHDSDYDLSSGGSVRVQMKTAGFTPEISSFTGVNAWGQKEDDETWVFRWTVGLSLASATNATWGANAKKIILGRLTGSTSPIDYTAVPIVDATDDSSSPSYDLALTGITSVRNGSSWVITARRAGGSPYTLRGERIRISNDSKGDLISWHGVTATSAVQSEELTVTHAFALSN